jgi:hypothetical protein
LHVLAAFAGTYVTTLCAWAVLPSASVAIAVIVFWPGWSVSGVE